MDVARVRYSRLQHRDPDAGGDFLDHRGPADVFGQNFGADRGAYGEPRLVRIAGLGIAREHVDMRRDHAVAAARPHHRNSRDSFARARAAFAQGAAIGQVGE